MTAYAKLPDLITRFGERELVQLTDREGTGEIDVGVVNRALSDACARADGYLGRLYAIPLRGCAKPLTGPGAPIEYSPPSSLTRLVCDLARYYLYDNAPEDHDCVRRFKLALSELKSLADGSTQLVCPWGGAPGEPLHGDGTEPQLAQHSFAPRRATDASLAGYA